MCLRANRWPRTLSDNRSKSTVCQKIDAQKGGERSPDRPLCEVTYVGAGRLERRRVQERDGVA